MPLSLITVSDAHRLHRVRDLLPKLNLLIAEINSLGGTDFPTIVPNDLCGSIMGKLLVKWNTMVDDATSDGMSWPRLILSDVCRMGAAGLASKVNEVITDVNDGNYPDQSSDSSESSGSSPSSLTSVSSASSLSSASSASSLSSNTPSSDSSASSLSSGPAVVMIWWTTTTGSPDPTGDYAEYGTHAEQPVYRRKSDNAYCVWYDTVASKWTVSDGVENIGLHAWRSTTPFMQATFEDENLESPTEDVTVDLVTP